MGFGVVPAPADTSRFATEHILEFQMVKNFLNSLGTGAPTVACYDTAQPVAFCKCMKSFWYDASPGDRITVNGVSKDAIDWVGSVFPSHENAWGNEFVLLDSDVNNIKEGLWGASVARNEDTMDYYTGEGEKAFKYVKDTIAVIRYHSDPLIHARLVAQKDRVGDMFNELETVYLPQITKKIGGKQVTWASLDLQTKWNQFMHDKGALAVTNSFLLAETYLDKLVKGYTTPAQREASARGTADADILQALIAKIDALQADYTNNKPVWTNPFP
jgi:chitinase